MANGRGRRDHGGRAVRLSGFQVARLHHLPSRHQCRRQYVSAAWHFPSTGLTGASGASRPQLTKCGNHCALFPRRKHGDALGGSEEYGLRPARSRANRSANLRHRCLPQYADRHLQGSTSEASGTARRPWAPMRNLPIVLGVSLLLALLTWLLLRGIDTNAPAYALVLRAFDNYSLAEASLHRDVLQARTGLLREYDSFSATARAMEDAVIRLRSYAQAEGLDLRPVDRLAASVVEQEELMERFKTGNALLQNSLSYVGLLSTGAAFRVQDPQLASATSALAAAVLYLARDRSSESLKELRERISQFAEQAPTVGPDAEVARAMLAHTRLLYDQPPAADETLKAFIAMPSEQPLEESRAVFAHHRSLVEAGEQRYRLLLYLVSLLLVIMLLYLGLRLRARAIALRRRAAFEHVIAENSTRLINCPPAENGARLP